jgi:diguanylate cyclase (GGDEF)-like protein/putative nucleotidyltransferase with HDIG domain
LDNFKQVNDRFGHQEGDAVLLRVTQGITDNLRPYDLAARLGGEEFGIIFPATAPADAKMVMDRIAAHVLGFGPNGERATFSAGITTYPLHAEEQSLLVQLADASSYTAKTNGKAQTVIYDRRIVHEMNSEAQIEQKSREAVMQTALTLATTVDTKDPYSRHHSVLTAIYAGTIARALGMDEEMVKTIYRAGLLHDVGKVGVADEILRKPGPLTEDEWTQVRLHPELGFQILSNADAEPIATWVRHHHEHWDGTGYPDRLAADQIPIGARIILVADAFEAMTSDRVYRRALTADQALDELARCAGSQFDPTLASTMVNLVRAGVFNQVWLQYGRQMRVTPLEDPATETGDAPPQAA